jgi:hypothetical protein
MNELLIFYIAFISVGITQVLKDLLVKYNIDTRAIYLSVGLLLFTFFWFFPSFFSSDSYLSQLSDVIITLTGFTGHIGFIKEVTNIK